MKNMERYGLAMVDHLVTHKDQTARQLQAMLEGEFPERRPYVHSVISWVRNKAGHEVLVREYDRNTHTHLYRLGLSAEDGYRYVTDRKAKVRAETSNIVGILNRIEHRFPADFDAEMRMARVMLDSVVRLLDA